MSNFRLALAGAALLAAASGAQAANLAVFGQNFIGGLYDDSHTVTYVTDAQLATAGFLDSYDAFVYTRDGYSFGVGLSVAAAANAEGLLGPEPLVLSAGGTALFDRVGEKFNAASLGRPLLKVLRSGCYLTHDDLGYSASFRRIMLETSLKLPRPRSVLQR